MNITTDRKTLLSEKSTFPLKEYPTVKGNTLTALRPTLAAIAGVLALAEELFISHWRLVGVRFTNMFHVVVVIRYANHHFGGLA